MAEQTGRVDGTHRLHRALVHALTEPNADQPTADRSMRPAPGASGQGRRVAAVDKSCERRARVLAQGCGVTNVCTCRTRDQLLFCRRLCSHAERERSVARSFTSTSVPSPSQSDPFWLVRVRHAANNVHLLYRVVPYVRRIVRSHSNRSLCPAARRRQRDAQRRSDRATARSVPLRDGAPCVTTLRRAQRCLVRSRPGVAWCATANRAMTRQFTGPGPGTT